ncbi:MAG: porin [Hyphomicrobium sp.]
MKRNLLLTASPLVLALGLSTLTSVSAQAADLGGNCCSDLEERIAELENTTARKGNRKVSVEINGWVNEGVFFWDDGKETNAYVGTNALEQSRFQFKGEAKVTSDIKAGYRLEIGLWGASSKEFYQDGTTFPATAPSLQELNALRVRHSVWYLSSKTYGKFSLGQTGTATYHLLDDLAAKTTRYVSDYEASGVYVGSFWVRDSATGDYADEGGKIRWTELMAGYNNSSPGQSSRRNVVKYDTPEIMGFTGTVAWGEDDLFDAALRYKQKHGDFDLKVNGGYGRSTQKTAGSLPPTGEYPSRSCGPSAPLQDVNGVGQGDFCQWWGVGGNIKHDPTGLYVYGAYGAQQVDLKPLTDPKGKPGSDISSTAYVQAGIEKKWWDLGTTTFFGEYRHDDVGQSRKGQESSLNFVTAGIVQQIDKAATELYLMYRHSDGDFTKFDGTNINLDALQMVITGARVQF